MPACAGMTVIVEKPVLKKHRHARAGGHPIWFLFDFNHLNPLSELFIFSVIIFSLASPVHADDFATRFQTSNPPRPLPPFVFQDGDGNQRSLADYRGRFVLLNIWATWCGPCVKEIPSLEALQRRMGGQLTVLPVSEDRTDGVVGFFYRRHGLKNLPIATDLSGTAAFALHVSALPTTLLINPQGQEIGRLQGDADWNSQTSLAIIYSQINASNHP
jgi:thiol-disulfide isomerase/thioredoxin